MIYFFSSFDKAKKKKVFHRADDKPSKTNGKRKSSLVIFCLFVTIIIISNSNKYDVWTFIPFRFFHDKFFFVFVFYRIDSHLLSEQIINNLCDEYKTRKKKNF